MLLDLKFPACCLCPTRGAHPSVRRTSIAPVSLASHPFRGHSGGEQRDLRESLASTDRARSPEARLVRAVSGESRPDEQAELVNRDVGLASSISQPNKDLT